MVVCNRSDLPVYLMQNRFIFDSNRIVKFQYSHDYDGIKISEIILSKYMYLKRMLLDYSKSL